MYANKHIAVSGNIGSGKTTLVHLLSNKIGAFPFYENNMQNPYLSCFYNDMDKWSFHSQIFFLIYKFYMYEKIRKCHGLVILDRTINEDAEIFAKALYDAKRISKKDFNTYILLYETIVSIIRCPDLIIYLKCPIPILQNRIILRNRKIEFSISESYLYKLHILYENWIEKCDKSKLLIIDTNQFNYINNLKDRNMVVTKIKTFICNHI